MSLRITTDIRRQLEAIANGLPRDFNSFPDKVYWTGADLLLTPLKTSQNGEPIDPEKLYQIDCPIFVEVNHFEKILGAFKMGGVGAVNRYVKELENKEFITVEL